VDLLEQLFHLSPDAGNGTTETLVIAGLVLAVGLVLLLKFSFRTEHARRAT
jgi:hypothetical protein